MSTRTTLRPEPVIVNGDMSANITSAVTVLQSISILNYSYSWSGSTPVGTISIQASNDFSLLPNGQVNNAGTWDTLPLNLSGTVVTSIPVSGNTGTGMVDIELTGTYAVRTVYTFASGTGTLQSIVTGKVA